MGTLPSIFVETKITVTALRWRTPRVRPSEIGKDRDENRINRLTRNENRINREITMPMTHEELKDI